MHTKKIDKISHAASHALHNAEGSKIFHERLNALLGSPRAHRISITLNIWALVSFVVTIAVLYRQAKRNREELIERIEALKTVGRTNTRPRKKKNQEEDK